jgi:hypothetical protein
VKGFVSVLRRIKETEEEGRTWLAVENFFSVLMAAPCRRAALSADSPLMTFSLGPAGPARTLLPILVTDSQSSDILSVVVMYMDDVEWL